ncbi:glycerate kinase [Fidelibacter multiformis]|uniref:glycerate kinase type-2 family protein n=1 Tax=Fidelibacter multiformis TaxID=3377529 RepID=UPI0037DCCC0E
MRKSNGNIAWDLENIILESIRTCHPEKIFPFWLNDLTIQTPYALLSIGKAAVSMAEVFLRHVLVTPALNCVITSSEYLPEKYSDDLSIYLGEHPYPGEKTERTSREVLDRILTDIPDYGHIVLLLSGGGSALFEIPQAGLSIKDISDVTKNLMKKGADIQTLNTIRKQMSAVKGGKLAQLLYPRKIKAFIMSDVVGDNLDLIASGPVTPDTGTPEKAREILSAYGLDSNIIKKTGQDTINFDFRHVSTTLISNNQTLIEACRKNIEKQGKQCRLLPFPLSGEASDCGKRIAEYIAASVKTTPVYYIGGGETSVTVRGNGIGGRNMEVTLKTGLELQQTPYTWGVACVGSDGVDGPTAAAGAVMTSQQFTKDMVEEGERALYNNDTYSFFKSHNGLIKTGYTGIHLNDLFVAYVDKPA